MSITLQNLTKSFRNGNVVDDLTLEISDGEFVVLLGPSGCGKTTTLRMIAGIEQVSSGEIMIDGRRVNELPPQRRDVAMVFQSYALYPHMTVAENIAYPLRIRKLDRTQIQKRVQHTAELLEIESLLQRKPRDLSGGERQRVALARSIVREPRAFLMDEPLSNLDARLRVQMRGELKHLQQQLGTTTVYVTHDQAEAMTLGHRVAVMNGGKLQQFDTPMNIYNRPANRFVAEFVGSPSMNFVEGEIDRARKTFTAGELVLLLGDECELSGASGLALLGIRPEHIGISSVRRDGWTAATVYVTELMGNETFVFFDLAGRRFIARAAGDFRVEMGGQVWINFDVTKAHLFDRLGQRI